MGGTPLSQEPQSFQAWLVGWIKSIAAALAIWIFLRSYVIEAFRIPSGSMENTLLVGDFLFVNKAVYGGQLEIPLTPLRMLRVPGYANPERGSIVVFRSVEDSSPNLDIVKRVIGAAGDTVQMIGDTLIRNGRRLDEPYALHLGQSDPDQPFRLIQFRAWQATRYIGRNPDKYHPTRHDWGPFVVPPDSFFVMGDNRDESYDSRYWGFLPRSHVVGQPLFIYMSVATDPFRIRWNRLLKHPS
ncbi:MAG TPA: signal peptidase I [Gemmatimonadales bacterium]|nr:signal peptidase I [Gemmatimonadales bacterium]